MEANEAPVDPLDDPLEALRSENAVLRRECRQYRRALRVLSEMSVLTQTAFLASKCRQDLDNIVNKLIVFRQHLNDIRDQHNGDDPWPQLDVSAVIQAVIDSTRIATKAEPKRRKGRPPKPRLKTRRKPTAKADDSSHVFLSRTKRLECQWPGCDAMFRDREDLENHKWRHTGTKPHQCDWPGCQKSFSSRCYLKKHHMTHIDPNVFKCLHDQCCEAFVSSADLNQHFGAKHGGHKPFPCNCGQEFAVKRNLKDHQIVHIDRKPFRCDWPGCESAFKRKQQLDIHVCEVHRTEGGLHCDWPGCDATFGSYNKLRFHRMKHTGEKPFGCSQCDWRFRQKNHLKTHLLKHSGEKPFQCQSCDRRFQTKQTMRFHVQKCHNFVVDVIDVKND